ncbi:MAG: DUF4369 domain-containing protein [Muribaculum sp.]|nr:DUF4369 domain-containing protein [Muribaculum sp.]
MKRLNIPTISALFALVAFLSACSGSGYKVEGSIANADPESYVVLERSDPNGAWLTLDSASLKNGEFSFSGPAASAPEIFRLRLKDRYVYFPIDSVETVTVNADARTFDTTFTLEGSDDAKAMERFEKQLIAFSPKASNPDSLSSFKRRIYSEFLKDAQGSVVSYYILTKTIGTEPLYNNEEDYKYFAAVATSFRQFRPDDPRTALLENISTEALRRRNAQKGQQRVIEANEVDLIDFELPDETGTNVRLSDRVGKGRPVVLIFSDMTTQGSPELNMQLRKLADTGSADFFQVSFDEDRIIWRNSAKNIPWTTVWAGDVTSKTKVATDYNLRSLPTFYIFNNQGQLTKRANSLDELKELGMRN